MDRVGATAIAMLEGALDLVYNKDLDIFPTSTSATLHQSTKSVTLSNLSRITVAKSALMLVPSPLIWKCTRPGSVTYKEWPKPRPRRDSTAHHLGLFIGILLATMSRY